MPDREENYKHLSVLVTQTFGETKISFHCFNRCLLNTYYGARNCTLEIQQRTRWTRALPLWSLQSSESDHDKYYTMRWWNPCGSQVWGQGPRCQASGITSTMLPVSRPREAKLHFTNYETRVQKVCINCPHLHSCYLLNLKQRPRLLSPQGLHTSLNLWLEFLQDQVSAGVLKAQVPTPPPPPHLEKGKQYRSAHSLFSH